MPVLIDQKSQTPAALIFQLLNRPLNPDAFPAVAADKRHHGIEAGDDIQFSAMRAGLAADSAGHRHPQERRFYFMGRHGVVSRNRNALVNHAARS
jgi:hypothetical protein